MWIDIYLGVTSLTLISVSVQMAGCSILDFYFNKILINLNVSIKTDFFMNPFFIYFILKSFIPWLFNTVIMPDWIPPDGCH